jgi:hypothetical protein
LEIQKRIKGADLIDTVATLNNIGSVYDKKGDFAKALEYYNKCIEIGKGKKRTRLN